ncbi:TonB-dependent siderophore receptor [Vibrio sp. OCN044]|uniref:TonB-dependent siderophore receptor n=1 Tax=Vibrio tetraodonis subsp. pristinus TaxID=2695891 RepID=A0A6L8LY79_9VIBR|nr:TonB-dependent receptor [Vibrio tetraodonis]MYM58162.1 TonB-dependent siderophore receptor [Vibrio tetraodonis subsp. pristinus]
MTFHYQKIATCPENNTLNVKLSPSRIALLVAVQFGTAALPVGLAHAEEQADESITVYGQANKAYAAGQISTTSNMGMLGDKDFMETPFNTIGYTEKQIQDQHAQDISEVISASDPSVFTSGATGLNLESIKIRGFDSAVGDMMFNGLYGIAPYYRSTPEMYQRIDVLKGPSSLLNGMPPNGSVGGAINLVPKRAQETPTTSFTGTYMSDSQFGGHLDLGRRFGSDNQFGLRFNGVFRDGDASVDNQEKQSQLASLGLDWRGNNAMIEADLYISKEHVDGPTRGLKVGSNVTELPSPPSSNTALAPDWAYNDSQDKGIMVRGELDINSHITTYTAIGASRTDFKSNIPSTIELTDSEGNLKITQGSVDLKSTRTSGEIGVRSNFSTGPVEHQLVINSTYFNEDKKDSPTRAMSSNTGETNIYNPSWIVENQSYNSYELPVDSTQVSYGIADTLSFANETFLLTLGIRHQSVDYRNAVGINGSIPPMTKLKESAITPAIAALYKFSPTVSLYANYAEGLTNGTTVTKTQYTNYGESFAPQKTKQTEVGLKLDLNTFAHTLSIFETKEPGEYEKDNTLSYDAEQRNRGVEWGFYGTLWEDYSLAGGIAYTDAELTKSADDNTQGKQAPKVPKVQAKLSLEWNLPTMRELTLIGQAQYMSKQYINEQNTLSVSGETIFDLGARYQSKIAEKNVTWRLAVNNVTDEDYWTTTHYADLALGAPRTVMLSASVDF